MKKYTYQNSLISKKQLKSLLSWSFTKYGSLKAGNLADKLKYLGFKYATSAGISISIEDLRVPNVKNSILNKANQQVLNAQKLYLKGKITNVERFQKIIDTWNITSEALKDEVVSYFKKYDPLNSVYIMAFSGARGNLSQVRQLVGMRGLMSDPSGEIMNLPIKKNFREGLTITDYLMSGYGARKGIVDTALKTANSGYLTRRLIDVAQDIIIREKDCLTNHSFLFGNLKYQKHKLGNFNNKLNGQLLTKAIYNSFNNELISNYNDQITPKLIQKLKKEKIQNVYIRSPLTCLLYRSICQKCYGWDLATENLVNMGEAIGIIAGQSIGEPGTQLTMRTFHTGGIFTSKANQQLISPMDGQIKFSKVLKTSKLRTNRGENVQVAESSGSLSIICQKDLKKILQIELPRNTFLFIKNNEFIKKDTIIGQLAGNIKQTRTETKHIICGNSGEIFIPKLKSNINSIIQNKLIWILAGEVYQAPMASFLNLFYDYKINKNSFIFRSKLINQYPGFIKKIKNQNQLFQQVIKIVTNIFCLNNGIIKQLLYNFNSKNYLLIINNTQKYFININSKNGPNLIMNNGSQDFGILIKNDFLTLTGGTPYYNNKLKRKSPFFISNYLYYLNNLEKKDVQSLIWLNEETYNINCNNNFSLVQDKSFILENTEILSKIFSKTTGLITIIEKKNNIQEISIKSGIVYKDLKIKEFKNEIYYPGEKILGSINITAPSFCEIFKINSIFNLLVRPLEFYEIPNPKSLNRFLQLKSKDMAGLKLTTNFTYLYSSGKKIKECKNIELFKTSFSFKFLQTSFTKRKKDTNSQITIKTKKNCLKFLSCEKLYLNNYLPASLKYKSIQSCFIVENKQFIDSYTKYGYLETITSKSLELVKLKSKRKQNKQLFLISNSNCLTINKNKIRNKTINNFIIDSSNFHQTGKILIDNGINLTLQKGQPYFFPNCKNDNFINNTDIKYRLIPGKEFLYTNSQFPTNKNLHINYYDITSRVPCNIEQNDRYQKLEFPRMMMKKRGKSYSSGFPIFIREFLINTNNKKINILSNLDKIPWIGYLDYKDKIYKTKRKTILSSINRIRFDNIFLMFIKNSNFTKNQLKTNFEYPVEFASIALLEHPFKTIGIHSITEDYFEQEVNSVYCKNGEFIENGETIGLINFEKEITGDIVQGLPRVEELLEARKKKRVSKHTSKNHKKSLLIRKTTIDYSFEFRKLGFPIQENEKINPHSLLKIYFNYYSKVKSFLCQRKRTVKICQLTDNYEASYRSFKKIQGLILNSVQAVYKTQGVMIADKHLEVIIKQMTTKVLITHEGETPLLPREVIDLYHIKYINQVVKHRRKSQAYYIPLLLGITKAALNNPSFISAASFQETTRVLTKATIEGRIDWLRGLKENIIIGHLIPAGTGSKNYVNIFKDKTIFLSY